MTRDILPSIPKGNKLKSVPGLEIGNSFRDPGHPASSQASTWARLCA
jgi:hypothetical protein